MKKSTIFLVVLTYIISFLVVGLFGISVRNYDSKVYVSKIVVSAPAQECDIVRKTDESGDIPNYLFYTPYTQEEVTIKLKASVEPAEATISDLKVIYDHSVKKYTVTQDDNIYFYVNVKGNTPSGVGYAEFTIETNDGEKKQTKVSVIISTDFYNLNKE